MRGGASTVLRPSRAQTEAAIDPAAQDGRFLSTRGKDAEKTGNDAVPRMSRVSSAPPGEPSPFSSTPRDPPLAPRSRRSFRTMKEARARCDLSPARPQQDGTPPTHFARSSPDPCRRRQCRRGASGTAPRGSTSTGTPPFAEWTRFRPAAPAPTSREPPALPVRRATARPRWASSRFPNSRHVRRSRRVRARVRLVGVKGREPSRPRGVSAPRLRRFRQKRRDLPPRACARRGWPRHASRRRPTARGVPVRCARLRRRHDL